MKLESELKLQAYLDGELSPRQARKVSAWLAQDQEAQQLFAELKNTKTALAGCDLDVRVPETPEFYWSKIQRAIESAAIPQPRPADHWLAAWRRLLAPLAGIALIAFLTIYSFRMYDGLEDSSRGPAVVENLSEHTGAYSFRSQSGNMFVVWVYDRSDEGNSETEPEDEQVNQ
jgi:hypothetical protein